MGTYWFCTVSDKMKKKLKGVAYAPLFTLL